MKQRIRVSTLMLALLLLGGIIASGCADNTAPPPEKRNQSPAEKQARQGKEG
jgi:hypothetical protein